MARLDQLIDFGIGARDDAVGYCEAKICKLKVLLVPIVVGDYFCLGSSH
jgi:hypothetical protein